MANRDDIMYTVKYGTYYNPAGSHYNSPLANCVCDNCGKSNLKICIGWNECDICLCCVEQITNSLYRDPYRNLDPYRDLNQPDSIQLPPGAMCGSWGPPPSF